MDTRQGLRKAEPNDDVPLDQRVRILEVGHGQLVDQMADIALEHQDMTQRLEEAIERGLERGAEKLIAKLQKQAAENTGRWLFGALKAVFTRWLLIAALVLTVGKFAGWPLATQVLDAIIGKGKP